MIYLDYKATTPVDPGVAKALLPFIFQHFGNPSSSHAYDLTAKTAVENARSQVAKLLNCTSRRTPAQYPEHQFPGLEWRAAKNFLKYMQNSANSWAMPNDQKTLQACIVMREAMIERMEACMTQLLSR